MPSENTLSSVSSSEVSAVWAPVETPVSEQMNSKPKKGKSPLLIASIAVLVLVVAATAGLYAMNYFTSQDLDGVRASVVEIDSKIAALRADNEVHSTELIHSNKSLIEHEIEGSKAQIAITKLMELKKAYGVDFAGFSFADKKISTVASVSADLNDREPSSKLVKFISDFRNKTGEASGSLLEMGEVRAVSGDINSRTFSIEFTVK